MGYWQVGPSGRQLSENGLNPEGLTDQREVKTKSNQPRATPWNKTKRNNKTPCRGKRKKQP